MTAAPARTSVIDFKTALTGVSAPTSARAWREHGVAISNHSQIAVQGIEGIEHDRGRAGAGEGRGNLVSDVSRFSYSYHYNLAPSVDRLLHQLDRGREIGSEPLA